MSMAPLDLAFNAAMNSARSRFHAREIPAAFDQLERAHVLGQRRFMRHLLVHLWMLRVGWAAQDVLEVRGQLLRLMLVPLGHISGRLPTGNTGRAKVSAFAPMPVAHDLAPLLVFGADERQGSGTQ